MIPAVAEYPLATLIPAHPSNYFRAHRNLSSIDHIVPHITDGRGLARPVAKMWQEPGHGSSGHFVIDQDGTVLQAVLLADVAYHAHAANRTSIGIEHCARSPGEKPFGPNDPGLPVSDAQYRASAKLVAFLCNVTGLYPTRTTIQGHCEIDPATTHKDCPNKIWDWPRYMTLVVDEYNRLRAGA